MVSRLFRSLSVLAVATWAVDASADVMAGPSTERLPGTDTGAPPPLVPRADHYHDGFYLRMSAGLGAFDTRSTADGISASATVMGAGPALDVLAGGTPLPGLVVGGGLLTQMAASPSVAYSGARVDGLANGASKEVTTWMAGPMIDVFPDPSGGLHLGGLLGLADLGLQDAAGNHARGVGMSVWAGYGFWAATQWSLGGLVRLSAIGTGRSIGTGATQYDVSDGTFAITAMFSACYH